MHLGRVSITLLSSSQNSVVSSKQGFLLTTGYLLLATIVIRR
jgi:hypothetical protein